MSQLKWTSIEPLTDADRAIDLPVMRPLYDSWRAAQRRLKESSHSNLKTFNERLVRSLSIETGILERLYDLDRGTTEALVTHGFAEDYVSRSSTDIAPSRLIDILRDQEARIQRLSTDGRLGNDARCGFRPRRCPPDGAEVAAMELSAACASSLPPVRSSPRLVPAAR